MTDDEWKKKLTEEQYTTLRKKGTESPFSGELLYNHKNGQYRCAGCGKVIFDSSTKFDSGSGWPSFYEPANVMAIKLVEDNTLGMHRVEVTCANCGGHLGHVFNDAPEQPTGMRFCINSTALDFKETNNKKAT